MMREIEGMSYAEMAKAMRVSKGTIMSRLHHARHKLQRLLKEYLDGEMVVR
jgi:RNA polymerase sigma-70 factor (ECF subfamily)